MEKKLAINLQFFAEDEEIEETPTEAEEADEVENPSDEDAGEADFEDGEQEDVDNDDEEENEDEEEEKPKKSNKQTRKDNFNSAQARIQKKKEEEERKLSEERIRREAYLKGVKEATKGVNPYTGEPIEDEVDLEIYNTMLEMEKKGLDPVEDYAKYSAEKRREQLKASKQEEERKKQIEQRADEEFVEFKNTYGEEIAENIFANKDFMEFGKKLFGRLTLSEVYDLFTRTQTEIEKKTTERVQEKEARRRSSTGGVGKKAPQEVDYSSFDPEEFHKLSLEIASRR